MKQLTEQEIESLPANRRFLVKELISRHIVVDLIDREQLAIRAQHKGHIEFFLDLDSSIMPYSLSVLIGNKHLTKKILKEANLSVMEGNEFSFENLNDALAYGYNMDFPVVVKPVNGSEGKGVYVDLYNTPELKYAIEDLQRKKLTHNFLLEKQFFGEEHRVFLTKEGRFAIIHREPAFVIGDGIHTTRELAEIESHRRLNPRQNCLGEIIIDEVVEKFLSRQNKALSDIPKLNEKVTLRFSSNLALGGFATDVTDHVHKSVIEICQETLRVCGGLPYAGIDFMSKDITKEQTPDSYCILEVNTVPGIGMHLFPGQGKGRPVTAYIVDMIFPETKA